MYAGIFKPRRSGVFRTFSSGDYPAMTHAFQSLLCLFMQLFAPRHNAQIRFLKASSRMLSRSAQLRTLSPSM